jgi:hypothetical protein
VNKESIQNAIGTGGDGADYIINSVGAGADPVGDGANHSVCAERDQVPSTDTRYNPSSVLTAVLVNGSNMVG